MINKRKIVAYGKKNRIPMNLSNYMAGCRDGYTAARKAFIDTVSGQPLEPVAICKALNAHKWTTETFKPYRPLTDGVSIVAVDPWGNEDIIEITKA